MIYIYDILTNFSKDKLYEFYEWKNTDEIINIKKIKLIRVRQTQLVDLLKYECIIEKELLSKIYQTCETYKKKTSRFDYTCLISDGNRVVAFIFDKEGKIIEKSNLLLDEETEIALLADNLDIYDIKYKKENKVEKTTFYTREEAKIYDYLYSEIENSYNAKEKSKLKYLYKEYFDKDIKNDNNVHKELLNSLKNINKRHKELYEILIQTKKQV